MEVEEYERVATITKHATTISTVVAIILNFWVVLSLLTDTLKIDLGKTVEDIVKHGWRLPPDWVQQYEFELSIMQWILLIAVIFDTGFSFSRMKGDKLDVSPKYLIPMSLIGMNCGLWLYLAYSVLAYGLIFFASMLTFVFAIIRLKKEGSGEFFK